MKFQLWHIFLKRKKIKKKFSAVKPIKNPKEVLENLYNQVTTSFDGTSYNKGMERYLRFRKYEILPKIEPYNICHNIENIRDQICKGKTMKKVIDLRKNFGDNQENIDQMNKNELMTAKSMNEMEDKMIKVFSGYKNY